MVAGLTVVMTGVKNRPPHKEGRGRCERSCLAEPHHFVTHQAGILTEETPRIVAEVIFDTLPWTGNAFRLCMRRAQAPSLNFGIAHFRHVVADLNEKMQRGAWIFNLKPCATCGPYLILFLPVTIAFKMLLHFIKRIVIWDEILRYRKDVQIRVIVACVM